MSSKVTIKRDRKKKKKESSGTPRTRGVQVVGPVEVTQVYMTGQVLTKIDSAKWYWRAVIDLKDGAGTVVNAKECVIIGNGLTVNGNSNYVVGSRCTINGSSTKLLGEESSTINGSGHTVVGDNITVNGSGHNVYSVGSVNHINGAGHTVYAKRIGSVNGAGHNIYWSSAKGYSHGVGHSFSTISWGKLEDTISDEVARLLAQVEERKAQLKKVFPRESVSGGGVTFTTGNSVFNVGNFSPANNVFFGSVSMGPGGIVMQGLNDLDALGDASDSSDDSDDSSSSEHEEKKRRKWDEPDRDRTKRARKEEAPVPAAAAAAKAPPKLPVEWKQDLIPMKDGQEDGKCAICFSYRSDAIVQPCGDLCMCMPCARKVASPDGACCPICKRKIEYIQGVRLVT